MKKKIRAIEALEITTFNIKNTSYWEFIEANHDIDKWLLQQPGFQSRHIAQNTDGTVIDVLVWNSVASGTNAMNRIIAETSDSKVHQMIDHGTVVWKCIPVHHRVNKK